MVCLVFDIPKNKKRFFILLGFVFVNHKFFIIIFIVQNTKKRKKEKRKKTEEGSNPLWSVWIEREGEGGGVE